MPPNAIAPIYAGSSIRPINAVSTMPKRGIEILAIILGMAILNISLLSVTAGLNIGRIKKDCCRAVFF